MSEPTAGPLRTDDDAPRWLVPGAYAAFVLCVVLAVVLPGGAIGEALYREVFPWVLLGTPPLASAVSALRGGGLLESIAIGAVPTAAFVLFGRSETLTVGAVGAVAAICLGGALAGFVAGYAGRELFSLYRAR